MRGGESACLLQFRIPKTLSRQSPTPLAFPKAVRAGVYRGRGRGPQLEVNKNSMGKNSFWSLIVPVWGEDENYFSFVAFWTCWEMLGGETLRQFRGLISISFPCAGRLIDCKNWT